MKTRNRNPLLSTPILMGVFCAVTPTYCILSANCAPRMESLLHIVEKERTCSLRVFTHLTYSKGCHKTTNVIYGVRFRSRGWLGMWSSAHDTKTFGTAAQTCQKSARSASLRNFLDVQFSLTFLILDPTPEVIDVCTISILSRR